MKIYSMTATFGKLEHQTLKLEPGLNVIHAPNEWGKSTWCAFLLNMLYGIDTKERTKLDSVADKDRYAPWSGAAMSGRIDLCWDGRDITIERSSNQRVPLGNFRAYETATGMEISELNANNCGQVLLGVERNVFVRAGFLKFSDLPVTQDDALRRRLNNLVTTGDESDDADKLRQALRDLKNKCRSNRSNGLIPEAEAQHARLKEQLWELQELTDQTRQLQDQKEILEQQLAALENHKAALNYAAAKEDARKVKDAKEAALVAQNRVDELTQAVKDLPSPEEAKKGVAEAAQLQAQTDLLLRQQQQLPEKPVAPAVPAGFAELTPQKALEQANRDLELYQTLETTRQKAGRTCTWLSIVLLLSGVVLFAAALLSQAHLIFGACAFAVVAACITVILVNKHFADIRNKQIQDIFDRHPGQPAKTWVSIAEQFAEQTTAYESQLAIYQAQTGDYTQQQAAYQVQLENFAGEHSLSQRQSYFEQAAFLWQELERAQRELEQTKGHAEALAAMAKTPPKPNAPDMLTHTGPETDFLLAQTKQELKNTEEAIAQNKGRIDALGQPSAIQSRLEAVSRRIARLETYNAAIELAQDQLYKITLMLQRRFSPRITKRTQELFSKLTGGRYQRITLGEDMGLQTASVDEVTLQELRRRSDGTIDQLYLALRLAVAGELTPNVPLILDDALVRFDDQRLGLALDILREEAAQKQVILFTCQTRENAYLSEQNSQ